MISTHQLTTEEKRQIDDDGYIVRKRVFNQDEVAEITESCERLIALFTEKLNLKRPHVGGPNPFHQDFPYWHGYADDATKIMTALLFLDDASLENGTLQVVPGSHKQGKWQTRTNADLFGNLEIDLTIMEDVDTVAVEVEAGSVVFFGPFLVHKSDVNTSASNRRALLYSYQPKRFASVMELERRRAAESHTAAALT